jgi:hypothetical protein
MDIGYFSTSWQVLRKMMINSMGFGVPEAIPDAAQRMLFEDSQFRKVKESSNFMKG